MKKCPECQSDEIRMERQGSITYCYKNGKIESVFHDMDRTVNYCSKCDWIEYDER